MSKKIKAVIFDMDGVLIDAKEWHYEALNKALSLFGMEISRYDHLVTYDGLPTRTKLEMLTLERGLPIELHDFISDLKQKYTMEMVFARCRPNFTHQYALCELKKKGYSIAVCSNSIRDTVKMMMEKSDLIGYLDFYYSNQDVLNGKPDPEIYTKAMKRLELEPSECMIIEDNHNGILAAEAAGGNVMQVTNVDEVNIENILKSISLFEGDDND